MRPQSHPPKQAQPPKVKLPIGACDAHVHIFAGADEFPRDPSRSEDPANGRLSDWCGRLQTRMDVLGLERVVLVHSVIYREDCTVTEAGLSVLGPKARAIALLEPDVSDAALDRLHKIGFRGVRLDLVYSGALTVRNVTGLLPRLADRGWHIQIFGKWTQNADAICLLAKTAPCPVVLDHLAYISQKNIHDLCRLVDKNDVYVKLSSIYRQEASTVSHAITDLLDINPQRLVWGSNWPHLRWNGEVPDEAGLVDNLMEIVPSKYHLDVFSHNAARLYDFPVTPLTNEGVA